MTGSAGDCLPVPFPSPRVIAGSNAEVILQVESSSLSARWLRMRVAVGPMMGSHQRDR